MNNLPSKLIDKLAKISRGLDEGNPEFNKKPRERLAKLLRSAVKKALALEDKCEAQAALISDNHTLITCAYSSLRGLNEQLTGNTDFEMALDLLHKAAVNDEIHWGVTTKDEVQNGNPMPNTDL